ncbi:MAG: helix-turn-helix domain-containing protein [Opitutales bacterium]
METDSGSREQGHTAAEPYITREEVSRRFQVGLRTIDSWTRRGLLPYFKVGNSVRFKWSDIDLHIQTHCRVRPHPPTES